MSWRQKLKPSPSRNVGGFLHIGVEDPCNVTVSTISGRPIVVRRIAYHVTLHLKKTDGGWAEDKLKTGVGRADGNPSITADSSRERAALAAYSLAVAFLDSPEGLELIREAGSVATHNYKVTALGEILDLEEERDKLNAQIAEKREAYRLMHGG